MKKHLFRCVSFLLTLCILSAPVTSFAETTFNDIDIDYQRAEGILDVGAKAPENGDPTEPVRLMILKPLQVGETIDSVVAALNAGSVSIIDKVVYVGEATVQDDRSFDFETIKIGVLPAGEYVLRMALGEEVYTETVAVATVEQAISMMNGVTSTDVMASNIKNYNDIYGLETDENSKYASLSEEGKKYVLENMCSVTYTDAASIQNRFNTYVQLSRVNCGPWGVAQEVIETDSVLLGINLASYNNLADAYKAEVAKALVGVKFDGTYDFAVAFKAAVSAATDAQDDAENKSNTGSYGGGGSVSMKSEFSATPNTPVSPTEVFRDLAGSEWAKESIYELYNKGIVNGKAEGVFAPADSITRAEAVKLIVMAFGGLDAEAKADFADVEKDSWMYPYIATAAKRGIVLGLGDGTVGAGNTITREDFATMVMRAAVSYGMSFDTTAAEVFADNSEISTYAAEAVYGLRNAGIINGAGDNMYMPKGVTSRAQAAKIIAGLI